MDIDTHALSESALLVVVGMAVVFTGLLILMVSAAVVVRLSRNDNNRIGKGVEGPPGVAAPAVADSSDKGAIAAVAVALALAMEKKGGSAPPATAVAGGPVVHAGAGSTWAASGREQLMRSRGKVGHRWGRRSE